jgi:hypothetical protein
MSTNNSAIGGQLELAGWDAIDGGMGYLEFLRVLIHV